MNTPSVRQSPDKHSLVTPIDGEARRFHVVSTRNLNSYLVDLDENGGFGQCGCEQFEYRIQPKLERKEQVDPCKHIVAAVAFERGTR